MSYSHILENGSESNLVEHLVQLRAKKAEIDKQVKNLESILKDEFFNNGQSYFESYEHTVKISQINTTRIDYKAIALHYGFSEYMEKKYTKHSSYLRLNVNAQIKIAV